MKNINAYTALMHIVSTVQYERMKQISEMEGEPFTSSLNICPEACYREGAGGITPPPPLTTTPFSK
jgi:hypothetical protein